MRERCFGTLAIGDWIRTRSSPRSLTSSVGRVHSQRHVGPSADGALGTAGGMDVGELAVRVRSAVAAQVVSEKASEWAERIWFLTADLSDAFGSVRYPLIRKLLERRVFRSTRVANRGRPIVLCFGTPSSTRPWAHSGRNGRGRAAASTSLPSWRTRKGRVQELGRRGRLLAYVDDLLLLAKSTITRTNAPGPARSLRVGTRVPGGKAHVVEQLPRRDGSVGARALGSASQHGVPRRPAERGSKLSTGPPIGVRRNGANSGPSKVICFPAPSAPVCG